MDEHLFNELKSNVREAVDIARGHKKPNVIRVVMSPEEIRAIRAGVRMSRAMFAHKFQLSIETVKGWEHGKRKPDAAAANFLRLIKADPQFVLVLHQTNNAGSAHPRAPRCKARPAGNIRYIAKGRNGALSQEARGATLARLSMGACGRALRVAAGRPRAALRRLEIRRGIPCATRLARNLPAATDPALLV